MFASRVVRFASQNEEKTLIDTARYAAESLFKRPQAQEGSNAQKLRDFRSRQILRKREVKLAELQQRLEKRAVDPAVTSFFR